MELWLLGAGAIVLVGITVWIVWPARATDVAASPSQGKEVLETSMTETNNEEKPVLPVPQDDRFDDQYTSATADLSAGGVAAAIEGMQEHSDRPAQPAPPVQPGQPPQSASPAQPGQPGQPAQPGQFAQPGTSTHTAAPAAAGAADASGSGSQAWSSTPSSSSPSSSSTPSGGSPGWSSSPADTNTRPWSTPSEFEAGSPVQRSVGLGAGVLLAVGGAVGGAWMYARWQRERNKPINRLRRGARVMGSRLGERMPDVDELPPATAPMSGAAAALLLSGLLASRLLNRGNKRADQANDASEGGGKGVKRGRQAAEAVGRQAMRHGRDAAEVGVRRGREAAETGVRRGREAAERGRKEARRFAERIPSDELAGLAADRQSRGVGLGLGGLGVVGAAAFLIWRLTRRPSEPKPWYAAG